MKITRLTLRRFRAAQEIDFADALQFDPSMNVFYGVNGAGKSSVLDAAALLLSQLAARLRSPNANGRPLVENDIQNGAAAAQIEINVQYQDRAFAWSLAKCQRGRQNAEIKSKYTGVNELSKLLAEKTPPLYPVLAFYPVTRAVIDIPLRIRDKHHFDPLSAYEKSLDRAADFRTFFEWFRQREDIENESLRDLDPNTRDPQLEAVRNALQSFLPGFSRLQVKRNPLRMEVQKGTQKLRVDQLSDGEKCLLVLIGDLARRLAIACENQNVNPLEAPGIVLIDEIDLHLHPQWQRVIVPRLRQTFPNCQFFLSTHSPLVLNQLHPRHLFLLENRDGELAVQRPKESYGKNSVRILEDIMCLPTTLPDEVAQILREIFDAIAENRFADAQNKIAELRENGFDEPELKSAEILMRRKGIIGK